MPEGRANVGPIIWSAVALLMTVIVVVAGVFTWRAVSGFATPVTRPVVVSFAAPVLQINPVDERLAYEQQQRQILNGYAWVDRDQRVVRIPIERAMQLLSERAK